MDTRTKKIKYIGSTYFDAEPFIDGQLADPNPATAKKNEDEAFARIKKRLSALVSDDVIEQKNAIAFDLVRLTRKLPHRLALAVLLDATQHPLFEDKASRQIIINARHRESYQHSLLLKKSSTVEFIKEYASMNSKEVADFLKNPEQLLLWINQASALEVSRLIQEFFNRDDNNPNYVHIRNLAQREHESGKPGGSLLCYTILCPGRLSDEGIANVEEALTVLNECERPGKFDRVVKTLRASIHPTVENITAASDCFVNLNKLELASGSNLNSLNLSGAKLNQSKLDDVWLELANLSSAQLNGTSLMHANLKLSNLQAARMWYAKLDFADMSRANLSNALLDYSSFTTTKLFLANLRGASLCYAKLDRTDLTNADLRVANFTGADLSTAKLQRVNLLFTILEGAKIDGAEFFTRNNGSSLTAELNHWQTMLSGHAYENELRTAILHDLIRYAKEFGPGRRATTINILNAAREHGLFKQVGMAKAGTNMLLSGAYSIWYGGSAKVEDSSYHNKSADEVLLLEELTRARAVLAEETRPPMPTSRPRPPIPDKPAPARPK